MRPRARSRPGSNLEAPHRGSSLRAPLSRSAIGDAASFMADLSILMPVYNEQATIWEAVQRVFDTELPIDGVELVVVDDGSTDATSSILADSSWPSELKVLSHPTNQGKGAAIRTAAAQASGEYSAILDADLEYDPADIGRLLEPMLAGRAEAVFGTREFESHTSYGAWYVLGNKTVTMAANLLYNSWISDLMTCLKAMRTERLKSLRLRGVRFRDRGRDRRTNPSIGNPDPRGPDHLHGALQGGGKEAAGGGCGSRDGDTAALPVRLRRSEEDLWDLRSLARARRLCDWMFEQYGGEVRGSVAEVGAGIGTFSERILAAGAESLLAVEPEPAPAAVLEERLHGDPRVTIVREQLPAAPSLRPSAFDLVVCQNVLEHIEDDVAAVGTLGTALRPDGRLVLLVPAHPGLFSELDRAFGHYRRYTRASLTRIVDRAGLRILDVRSFNLLGIPGWWAKKLRRSEQLGPGSLAAYEALVRFWRPVENRISIPWGLSLVLHAAPHRPL